MAQGMDGIGNPTLFLRGTSSMPSSGLGIWHCHSGSVGYSCGSDSVPDLGTSICQVCN